MKNKTVEAVVGFTIVLFAVIAIVLSRPLDVSISLSFSVIALMYGVGVIGWSIGGKEFRESGRTK